MKKMPIYKLKGQHGELPPRPKALALLFAWLGCFVFITFMSLSNDLFSAILIMTSFGSSSILVFAYPEAPFSQPRNIFFGHLLSTIISLSFFSILGYHWWALALAASTSIVVMMFLRVMHPPAGSNPMTVFIATPGWDFLLLPVLTGTVCIICFALIYNNIVHKKEYPIYW